VAATGIQVGLNTGGLILAVQEFAIEPFANLGAVAFSVKIIEAIHSFMKMIRIGVASTTLSDANVGAICFGTGELDVAPMGH
jgi:hypothetical protein